MTPPTLLLAGSLAVLLLSADPARAACRHGGLSADEVLRLVQEQSSSSRLQSPADVQPRGSLDEDGTPSISYLVPLRCDKNTPVVRSVVPAGLSALAAVAAGGTTPQITWHDPGRSPLHALHLPQAHAPPPRA